MSQKNETPILILALILTVGLLGGAGWWVWSQFQSNFSSAPSSPLNPSSSPNSATPSTSPSNASTPQMSAGETVLFPSIGTERKQSAIAAIAAGNLSQAVQDLQASLQIERNDPEVLIYLNNLRIVSESHTIAVAVPISSAPDAALEILRGVAQAQNEVNQNNGINGIPLRIVIVDDRGDDAVAVQAAEAIADMPEILGVVGHFSSASSQAAGEVYQQEGVVMISPTSTSVTLSQLGDYVFRTVQSDRFAATSLARHMLEQMQVQRAAVFYNLQSDYSQSLKNAFTEILISEGGQVVAEFDVSQGFSAAQSVEQAIAEGAQALFLATNTSTRPQAFDVIAANQQRLQLLGGDSLYNAEILQVAKANAAGMIVAAPWHREANPNAPFPSAARQLWGGDVSWRTAMSYDATKALVAAIEQQPNRAGISQVLSQPNFAIDGASGTIQFTPSGDRAQQTQLVEIEVQAAAQYGYTFAPVN